MKEKKIGIVNLNPKFALKWKFFLPQKPKTPKTPKPRDLMNKDKSFYYMPVVDASDLLHL